LPCGRKPRTKLRRLPRPLHTLAEGRDGGRRLLFLKEIRIKIMIKIKKTGGDEGRGEEVALSERD
jgi:hypothetical protein